MGWWANLWAKKPSVPCSHEWKDMTKWHREKGASRGDGSWWERGGKQAYRECVRCAICTDFADIEWREWEVMARYYYGY